MMENIRKPEKVPDVLKSFFFEFFFLLNKI